MSLFRTRSGDVGIGEKNANRTIADDFHLAQTGIEVTGNRRQIPLEDNGIDVQTFRQENGPAKARVRPAKGDVEGSGQRISFEDDSRWIPDSLPEPDGHVGQAEGEIDSID